MPTRLLDIASNPLMALYFACKSNMDKTGEVVIKIRRNEIKFFDSDTASCIANLARLPNHDKDAIDFALGDTAFNESLPGDTLTAFRQRRKIVLSPEDSPADLKRILCVKGRMTDNRITSQSGAFLLFGLHATLPEEGDADVSSRANHDQGVGESQDPPRVG